MIRFISSLLFVTMFLSLNNTLFAQDVAVCKLIGKSNSDVIKKYGKPIHQDLSNPEMQCLFYQTKDYRLVFVSNKDGVYQAEGELKYNSKENANAVIHSFLTECISDSLLVDTVNTSEYNVKGKNFKMNISLYENNFSKKYEVRVKANRVGG
ncbi:hypothetical protein ABRY23_13475 [Melioribacteraceae bacterium 4301-Me]|uniref:hypothetical protein n=1 Tax=Pyranulibacter aquaticus TaxID=3163344 RepID=UPI003599C76C